MINLGLDAQYSEENDSQWAQIPAGDVTPHHLEVEEKYNQYPNPYLHLFLNTLILTLIHGSRTDEVLPVDRAAPAFTSLLAL